MAKCGSKPERRGWASGCFLFFLFIWTGCSAAVPSGSPCVSVPGLCLSFKFRYLSFRVSANKSFLDPSFGIQHPTNLPDNCDIKLESIVTENCKQTGRKREYKQQLQITTTENLRNEIQKGEGEQPEHVASE